MTILSKNNNKKRFFDNFDFRILKKKFYDLNIFFILHYYLVFITEIHFYRFLTIFFYYIVDLIVTKYNYLI